jgi:hypothetical protein
MCLRALRLGPALCAIANVLDPRFPAFGHAIAMFLRNLAHGTMMQSEFRDAAFSLVSARDLRSQRFFQRRYSPESPDYSKFQSITQRPTIFSAGIKGVF